MYGLLTIAQPTNSIMFEDHRTRASSSTHQTTLYVGSQRGRYCSLVGAGVFRVDGGSKSK